MEFVGEYEHCVGCFPVIDLHQPLSRPISYCCESSFHQTAGCSAEVHRETDALFWGSLFSEDLIDVHKEQSKWENTALWDTLLYDHLFVSVSLSLVPGSSVLEVLADPYVQSPSYLVSAVLLLAHLALLCQRLFPNPPRQQRCVLSYGRHLQFPEQCGFPDLLWI